MQEGGCEVEFNALIVETGPRSYADPLNEIKTEVIVCSYTQKALRKRINMKAYNQKTTKVTEGERK